jgi:dihydroorotate dehydrogenase
MKTAVRTVSGYGYRRIVKPVLFLQSPDKVHNKMLTLSGGIQKHPSFLAALHAAWAYEDQATLGQEIHGITFKNPIGLSAGFDKNFELPPLLKAIGFGFMEGGSLTYYPCAGNPRPWYYRLPASKSLVVHAGLGNQGVAASMRRLSKYPVDTFSDFPLNISVAKTNSPNAITDNEAIDDYAGSLRVIRVAQQGHMITLNISCPNTYGGEPFTTPKRLERLLTRVDSMHLDKPIFVKMPCDLAWKEFKALLQVADRHVIAGVTVSNLAKSRIQVRIKDNLPDYVQGGLSGKPTWEKSNMLIQRTYREFGKRFTIIGVGGVFSAEDAYTKITLGASLVELITGMVFEGPQLIGTINHGLVGLLKRDGYKNISEAIGTKA